MRLRSLSILGLVFSTACTTWQTDPALKGHTLAPESRVRLWVQRRSYDVHAVRVAGDTVTAIRFFQPRTCDSCVMRFRAADVDSVQTQVMDAHMVVFAAAIAIPLLVAVIRAGQIPRT